MSRTLDLPAVFKEGINTVRKEYVLLAPIFIVLPLAVLILTPFLARLPLGNPLEDIRGLILGISIGSVLNVYVLGVTVAMPYEVMEKGSTSLRTGLMVALRFFPRLLPVSLLLGLSTSIGFLVMIFPGMILAFLFMYTMPAMFRGNLLPFDALATSFRTVKETFTPSLFLFTALATSMFIISLVMFPLFYYPALGLIANFAVSAVFLAVSSVVLMRAYIVLSPPITEDAPPPPKE
jgi:hypothetical protein